MNKSIKNRHFLEFLKEANITPIFEKDDPLDKSYYRPICILPLFSKVYKRHIYNYLLHCTEQTQQPRGVLRKRCSENMQQIYRRTPRPKSDFNKVTLKLY